MYQFVAPCKSSLAEDFGEGYITLMVDNESTDTTNNVSYPT